MSDTPVTISDRRPGYEWFLMMTLVVAAALIRAPGLGKWPLAIDEYYFSQSISFIQKEGIPRFPDGGYYVRGIALQYSSLIPVMLIKNRELAVRLLPLLFGIMSIPVFYLLCRKFCSPIPSALSAISLLFSSWHIEFSRFARMYVPFQFLLFLFLYLMYSGYYQNRQKNIKWAWLVGFLAVLFYEGSIFIPIFLVLVLVREWQQKTHNPLKILVGIVALLLLNYIAHGIPYVRIGVTNPLPPEAGQYFDLAKKEYPVNFPDISLFMSLWETPYYYIPYLFVIPIGGIAAISYLLRKDYSRINILVFSLALAGVVFHQYTISIIILSIAVLMQKNMIDTLKSGYRIAVFYAASSIMFWTAIAYHSGNMAKIKGYLIGYPYFKYNIYPEFVDVVPVWGALLTGVLAFSLIRSVYSSEDRGIEFPTAILILCFIMVSVLTTPVKTSRYCFPFYPLLLVILFFEAESLYKLFLSKGNMGHSSSALLIVPLVLLFSTEDYHMKHITASSSAEINFRMGGYARYANHWYPRADTRTPCSYVDNVFRDGDVIVLEDPPMSPYISKPYLNYIHISNVRIPYESRKSGTEEMWTGMPLLYKEEHIATAVPENGTNSLWLVAVRQDYIDTSFEKTSPESLAQKYGLDVQLRYVSMDGRIGSWEIKRKKNIQPQEIGRIPVDAGRERVSRK